MDVVSGDVTLQSGEGVTAFTVRRIQHHAWISGHDVACIYSLHPCEIATQARTETSR